MYGLIISIDPGANGSITHVRLKEGKPVEQPVCVKMPKDVKQMIEYFGTLTQGIERKICFIEKVNMFRGDAASGKHFGIEKLVQNFNFLKAAMVANDLNFIEVPAVTWQSRLKLKLPREEAKKETQTQRKNRYKQEAQKRFKSLKVTLWNSDALLILYFGVLQMEQNSQWLRERLPREDLDLLF